MSSSGRGQVLIPWPNRVLDGSYEFDGRRHQLPIDDVEEQDAIHGLVRWAAWTVGEREPDRVVMEHVLHPQPGYPFSLALAIEYALSDEGLRVAATATNLGTSARAPTERRASLSDRRDADGRLADPARAGADGAALRRARHPGRRRLRRGHATTTFADRGRSARLGSTTPSPTSSATTTASLASSCAIPTKTAG